LKKYIDRHSFNCAKNSDNFIALKHLENFVQTLILKILECLEKLFRYKIICIVLNLVYHSLSLKSKQTTYYCKHFILLDIWIEGSPLGEA